MNMTKNDVKKAAPKRDWARPEVVRLEAGSAESLRGSNPDGGGGNQGS